MPKVLTAARVRVPTQNETEYVNTLRELSQFAEARGQRIWLYRNAKDPRLFIEFSESPTEMSHRAQASRLPEEIKLERRLQAVATHAPDAWELWSEVPLAPPPHNRRLARPTIAVGGEKWEASPAGRVTVYRRDQFG